MKQRIIVFAVLTIFALGINAQDKKSETGWENSGVVGLNLSQISFSNWSQGGENSLSFAVFGNFAFNYSQKEWKLTNQLKLTYGKTKLENQDAKINDNEFYLENVFSYLTWKNFNPFVSNIAQSVLAPGYDYTTSPFTQQSAFFDPGYLSQSIGLEYVKGKVFKSRLGVALQETFTQKFNKYTDDETTTEIEKSKFETGIGSVTEVKFPVAENIVYNGYLRLFGRFNDLGLWDVRWDNTLTMKVNSFLNVNLNVLVVYRKIETPKTQVKEALMLGFSYTLF